MPWAEVPAAAVGEAEEVGGGASGSWVEEDLEWRGNDH